MITAHTLFLEVREAWGQSCGDLCTGASSVRAMALRRLIVLESSCGQPRRPTDKTAMARSPLPDEAARKLQRLQAPAGARSSQAALTVLRRLTPPSLLRRALGRPSPSQATLPAPRQSDSDESQRSVQQWVLSALLRRGASRPPPPPPQPERAACASPGPVASTPCPAAAGRRRPRR